MTLGTGLLIDLAVTTNWVKIILYQAIAGVGAGPLFQAPMIAMQSHLPHKDIAAASSASMFLRNLSSSVSIIVGSVILQKNLGGSLTEGGARSEVSSTDYASAMKLMWIFYTAMAGIMTLAAVLIENMPRQNKSEQMASTRLEDVSLSDDGIDSK